MNILRKKYFLVLPAAVLLFFSCQKETGNGGGGNNTNTQKPKVGTTWTYTYYTYYPNGGLDKTATLTYRATSEETLGGEKWLKITHAGPDTVVYYLREKTDGLYQYANNNAWLLCKNPASVNETYTSFNSGSSEDFKVLAVNQTLPTNLGDIKANNYEGRKSGNLIDLIWFNANAWIVQHTVYRKFAGATDYFKYSDLFITSIVY